MPDCKRARHTLVSTGRPFQGCAGRQRSLFSESRLRQGCLRHLHIPDPIGGSLRRASWLPPNAPPYEIAWPCHRFPEAYPSRFLEVFLDRFSRAYPGQFPDVLLSRFPWAYSGRFPGAFSSQFPWPYQGQFPAVLPDRFL